MTSASTPWPPDEIEERWNALSKHEPIDIYEARALLLKIYPPFLLDWQIYVTKGLMAVSEDGMERRNTAFSIESTWLIDVLDSLGNLQSDFICRRPEPPVVHLEDTANRPHPRYFIPRPNFAFVRLDLRADKKTLLASLAKIIDTSKAAAPKYSGPGDRVFDLAPGQEYRPINVKTKFQGIHKADWFIFKRHIEGKSAERIASEKKEILKLEDHPRTIARRIKDTLIPFIDPRNATQNWDTRRGWF